MSRELPSPGAARAATPVQDQWRDLNQGAAVNLTRGLSLASRVEVADSFWQRFWGLLRRRELEAGSAMLLTHCSSVHTLGMAFPIDVLHLDADGTVRAVITSMRPWRLGPWVRGSCQVLELPAGASAGTRVGDTVRLASPPR